MEKMENVTYKQSDSVAAQVACEMAMDSLLEELIPSAACISLRSEHSMSSVLAGAYNSAASVYPVVANIVFHLCRNKPRFIGLYDVLDRNTEAKILNNGGHGALVGVSIAVNGYISKFNDVITRHLEANRGRELETDIYMLGLSVGEYVLDAIVDVSSSEVRFELYDTSLKEPMMIDYKGMANDIIKSIPHACIDCEDVLIDAVKSTINNWFFFEKELEDELAEFTGDGRKVFRERQLNDEERRLFIAGFYPHGVNELVKKASKMRGGGNYRTELPRVHPTVSFTY